MSYRRKRLIVLLGVAVLAFSSVAGCTSGNIKETDGTETIQESRTEENSNLTETEGYTYSEMFTGRDISGEYDESEAVKITLSDDASEVNGNASGVSIEGNTVTITEEGTYHFTGTLSEGQIIVDADEAKVQIVLDGVEITCEESAAVYVKSADKVFVTLQDGSQNSLSHTGAYVAVDDNNIDAVIFAKSDLTLNGTGTLTIHAEEGHGIVSKDDLKITGGTYEITAAKHALSGKNSVRIADGTFTLTSGKDGIHVENEDTEKGFLYIADGDFTIVSDGDGMDASGKVQIEDGTFDITAGGGSKNGKAHTNDMPGGGKGGGFPGGGFPGGNADGDPDGEFPGNPPEDFSEDAVQDGTEIDTSGTSPGRPPQMGDAGDTENTDRPTPPQMDENAENSDRPTPPEKPDGENQSDFPDQGQKDESGINAQENETASNNQDDTQTIQSGTVNESEMSEEESSASTKGIKAGGDLLLNGGTYTLDTADDSIHSNSKITVNGGTYTMNAGDDGIHADDALVINGGTITIEQSYEGLEGMTVTINDGTIDITSDDDGINAAGGTENEMWMEINGGYIHILAGGDGIDSNGDLTINGGEIYIDGPSDNGNSAIDYGDWSDACVNGGLLVAIGSSGMAEEMSDESTQSLVFAKLDSQIEAGEVTLSDSDGNVIVSYTSLKSYDCVIISAADLVEGETYTLMTSGETMDIVAE